MNKILIATDSFKDCMSAQEACCAIEKGVQRAGFHDYHSVPLADGGEGTLEVLLNNRSYHEEKVIVKNSLGKDTKRILYVIDNTVAIIEVASICGIEELSASERNPYNTTTYGMGEMILFALDKGIRDFIVTLGGSSTNDGGVGMLQAIGARIHVNKEPLFDMFKGKHLPNLTDIVFDHIDSRVYESRFQIACDVQNQLIGDTGATYVFAKQKGADERMQLQLEKGMVKYADIIRKKYIIDPYTPKTGAAGGLSMAFLLINATLVAGIDMVMQHVQLHKKIRECDLIITGEGSIDYQTAHGKTISGLLKVAKEYHKPVLAFCGKIDQNIDELYTLGLVSAFSISPGSIDLASALRDGGIHLEQTVFNVMQVLNLKEK